MNLLKIIETLDLEKIDQEQFLKPAMRRNLFKKASDYSLKAALTSLPFAMMAMPSIVKAQTSNATAALSLALKLEFLERDFYTKAVAAMNSGAYGASSTANLAVFQQILKHETDHVTFLQTALGSAAPVEPTFDFTVGGQFTPFSNYTQFLDFSQAFEDTGVRAYKGQATNLMGTGATLTAALQIHSVEARHAAEVRRIRGQKGWITGSEDGDTNFPSAFAAVYGAGSDATNYPAENNTTQGGVDLATYLNGTNGEPSIAATSITEAFDEPLDTATVVAIFNTFCTANC